MTLLPEDMDGGAVQHSDGSYTVTDSTGQEFRMSEEAFEEFSTNLGGTLDDLDFYRQQVTGGSVIRLREGANPEVLNPSMFQEVDTTTLKFGAFDDAVDLQRVYKGTFYPKRAEQIDRIFHGLDTGRVVSEEIKTNYIEADGNVSADVVSIDSQFEGRGGSITDSDVAEVENENEEDSLTEPEAEDPAANS